MPPRPLPATARVSFSSSSPATFSRETGSLPAFDAVFARLEALVGDVGKFKRPTASNNYFYALTLDAYPGLTAISASYLTMAQA